MYAPHDRPYAGVIQGARYNLVMFDPELLDQVAATARGRGSEPVRLTGDRRIPAAARQLRTTIAYLYGTALADPVMRDSPLIASALSQHLAASVLSTFPSNALLEPATADSRDAHPAALRRAVAYINAHRQPRPEAGPGVRRATRPQSALGWTPSRAQLLRPAGTVVHSDRGSQFRASVGGVGERALSPSCRTSPSSQASLGG